MKLLLDYGVDVDSLDKTGRTPLWVAASEDGRDSFITCLVEGGADIQLCDRREKRTPLHV
jgi:ankyrin repeat protein